MALPDDELSLLAVPGPLLNEKEVKVRRTSDFELGGVALNDPSLGLDYQEWNTYVSTDGTQIRIRTENQPDTLLYTGEFITEVSGTFDQNMRPTFAFVENEEAKLYWYDTAIQDFTVTNYGPDVETPKVSMDDKREFASSYNDIIFAYVREGRLYHRRQRDRYQDEILLHPYVTPYGELHCIGMSRNLRFSFQFRFPQDIRD